MVGQAFADQEFNILSGIKFHFVPSTEEDLFHGGNVIHLGLDAVHFHQHGIVTAKTQLYGHIGSVTLACFSQGTIEQHPQAGHLVEVAAFLQ